MDTDLDDLLEWKNIQLQSMIDCVTSMREEVAADRESTVATFRLSVEALLENNNGLTFVLDSFPELLEEPVSEVNWIQEGF
jgi:hypothetical protein